MSAAEDDAWAVATGRASAEQAERHAFNERNERRRRRRDAYVKISPPVDDDFSDLPNVPDLET